MKTKLVILMLGLVALVSGCYEQPRDPERPKVTLETLKAKVAAEVAKGPQVTTHKTEHGQIIVVAIPKAGLINVHWFECVIFRDAEFKTSSISCPPEIDPSDYHMMSEP